MSAASEYEPTVQQDYGPTTSSDNICEHVLEHKLAEKMDVSSVRAPVLRAITTLSPTRGDPEPDSTNPESIIHSVHKIDNKEIKFHINEKRCDAEMSVNSLSRIVRIEETSINDVGHIAYPIVPETEDSGDSNYVENTATLIQPINSAIVQNVTKLPQNFTINVDAAVGNITAIQNVSQDVTGNQTLWLPTILATSAATDIKNEEDRAPGVSQIIITSESYISDATQANRRTNIITEASYLGRPKSSKVQILSNISLPKSSNYSQQYIVHSKEVIPSSLYGTQNQVYKLSATAISQKHINNNMLSTKPPKNQSLIGSSSLSPSVINSSPVKNVSYSHTYAKTTNKINNGASLNAMVAVSSGNTQCHILSRVVSGPNKISVHSGRKSGNALKSSKNSQSSGQKNQSRSVKIIQQAGNTHKADGKSWPVTNVTYKGQTASYGVESNTSMVIQKIGSPSQKIQQPMALQKVTNLERLVLQSPCGPVLISTAPLSSSLPKGPHYVQSGSTPNLRYVQTYGHENQLSAVSQVSANQQLTAQILQSLSQPKLMLHQSSTPIHTLKGTMSPIVNVAEEHVDIKGRNPRRTVLGDKTLLLTADDIVGVEEKPNLPDELRRYSYQALALVMLDHTYSLPAEKQLPISPPSTTEASISPVPTSPTPTSTPISPIKKNSPLPITSISQEEPPVTTTSVVGAATVTPVTSVPIGTLTFKPQPPLTTQEDDTASIISSVEGERRPPLPGGSDTETAPEGEEEGKTRCICDFTHDDGYMICCDRCGEWQHVDCMGIDRNNIPDAYMCELCHPRPIDRRQARIIQLRKREELSALGASDSDSSECTRLPGQRRKRLLTVTTYTNTSGSCVTTYNSAPPTLPPLPQPTVTIPKRGPKRPKKVEVVRKGTKRKLSEKRVKRKKELMFSKSKYNSSMSNQSHWRDLYELAMTNHYSPELRAKIIKYSNKLGNTSNMASAITAHLCTTVPHAGGKILIATKDLKENTPVIELRGKYMLSNQHRPQLQNSARAGSQKPGPFVFFYRLPKDNTQICIDTRTYGNEARFVRRSCKPNAELQHCIVKGALHVYLVTIGDIQSNTEITVGHDSNGSKQPCACGNPKHCKVNGLNALLPRKNIDYPQREKRSRNRCFSSSSPVSPPAAPLTTPTKEMSSPFSPIKTEKKSPIKYENSPIKHEYPPMSPIKEATLPFNFNEPIKSEIFDLKPDIHEIDLTAREEMKSDLDEPDFVKIESIQGNLPLAETEIKFENNHIIEKPNIVAKECINKEEPEHPLVSEEEELGVKKFLKEEPKEYKKMDRDRPLTRGGVFKVEERPFTRRALKDEVKPFTRGIFKDEERPFTQGLSKEDKRPFSRVLSKEEVKPLARRLLHEEERAFTRRILKEEEHGFSRIVSKDEERPFARRLAKEEVQPFIPRVLKEVERPFTRRLLKEEEQPFSRRVSKEEERPLNRGLLKEEERPLTRGGALKEDERPFTRGGGLKEEEQLFNRGGALKDDERPFTRAGALKEDERPFTRGGALKEDERPFTRGGALKEDERPFTRVGALKEDERPFTRGVVKEDEKPFTSGVLKEEVRPFTRGIHKEEVRPFTRGILKEEVKPFTRRVLKVEERPFTRRALKEEEKPINQGMLKEESKSLLQEIMKEEERPFTGGIVLKEEETPVIREGVLKEEDRLVVTGVILKDDKVYKDEERPVTREAIAKSVCHDRSSRSSRNTCLNRDSLDDKTDDSQDKIQTVSSKEKDKRKMTREERKMEAIMKAFERMEKAQQRKQEVKERQKRRESDPHPTNIMERDDDDDIHSTRKRKRRRGRARTASQSAHSARRRLNSADSEQLTSGDEAGADHVDHADLADHTDHTDHAELPPAHHSLNEDLGLSSACLLVEAAVGSVESAFKLPKTKKTMANEWLGRSPERTPSPYNSPYRPTLVTAPSLESLVRVASTMIGDLSANQEYHEEVQSRSPPRTPGRDRSKPPKKAKRITRSTPTIEVPEIAPVMQHSAKKRWLRQAISEESDSPNTESPPNEIVTPLKKRRMARESLSCEQNTTVPCNDITSPVLTSEDSPVKEDSLALARQYKRSMMDMYSRDRTRSDSGQGSDDQCNIDHDLLNSNIKGPHDSEHIRRIIGVPTPEEELPLAITKPEDIQTNNNNLELEESNYNKVVPMEIDTTVITQSKIESNENSSEVKGLDSPNDKVHSSQSADTSGNSSPQRDEMDDIQKKIHSFHTENILILKSRNKKPPKEKRKKVNLNFDLNMVDDQISVQLRTENDTNSKSPEVNGDLHEELNSHEDAKMHVSPENIPLPPVESIPLPPPENIPLPEEPSPIPNILPPETIPLPEEPMKPVKLDKPDSPPPSIEKPEEKEPEEKLSVLENTLPFSTRFSSTGLFSGIFSNISNTFEMDSSINENIPNMTLIKSAIDRTTSLDNSLFDKDSISPVDELKSVQEILTRVSNMDSNNSVLLSGVLRPAPAPAPNAPAAPLAAGPPAGPPARPRPRPRPRPLDPRLHPPPPDKPKPVRRKLSISEYRKRQLGSGAAAEEGGSGSGGEADGGDWSRGSSSASLSPPRVDAAASAGTATVDELELRLQRDLATQLPQGVFDAQPTASERQRENLSSRLRREFGLALPDDDAHDAHAQDAHAHDAHAHTPNAADSRRGGR